MNLKVATRFSGETDGEKCPKCNVIFTNFIKISDVLWGCFKCGSVFIPKRHRNIGSEELKRIIESQKKMADENAQKGMNGNKAAAAGS